MRGIVCGVLVCMWVAFAVQTAAKTLRVASFGDDISGITTLDHSFDTEAYSVITQIFDSLVAIDLKGRLVPALAVSWRLIDSNTYEFDLRKGVSFHNGEPFTSGCVKFTYEAVIHPEINAGNAWILNSIAGVDVVDKHRVRIRLRHPDGMFLYRLSMFGAIVPPKYINEKGMDYFNSNPVGTGPFSFERWDREEQIVLKKNSSYWETGIPVYDELIFKIIPENQWLDALKNDKVDVVTRVHPNRISELISDGRFKILQRLVLQGYWVMFRNKGPLADVNVRKAINYAVNKKNLILMQSGGLGTPLRSLGKLGEIGRHPDLKGYAFNPVLAGSLLDNAGYRNGFTLKAIAIKGTELLANAVREDLSLVGIDMKLEFVSRREWTGKMINGKAKGQPYDVDIAIILVDNPIVNLGFHAGLFLASSSPWSLMNDPEFDRRFESALFKTVPLEHIDALQELDKYIHDQALMLFTFQTQRVFAMKKDIIIPDVGINGHVDYFVFSHAR